MARRHSVIAGQMNHKIRQAMLRHRYLRMYDAPFDAVDITDMMFAKTMRLITEAEEAMPYHSKGLWKYDSTTEYNVSIPLPVATHQCDRQRGVAGDQLLTLQGYKGRMRGDEMGVVTKKIMNRLRCVSLNIETPFPVPSMWQSSNADEEGLNGNISGAIMTPEMVGAEKFKMYQDAAVKLDGAMFILAYMEHFAKAVTLLCTTHGITKRMWPEAAEFLGPGTAESIRQANPSQYPQHARHQLNSGTPTVATAEYMHKQLKTITDVILSAQLMPSVEDMKPDAKRRVDMAYIDQVSITTLPMFRVEKEFPELLDY